MEIQSPNEFFGLESLADGELNELLAMVRSVTMIVPERGPAISFFGRCLVLLRQEMLARGYDTATGLRGAAEAERILQEAEHEQR